MSEVKRFVTRYSRDFEGNLSVDPNGSWVLAADAAMHAKKLTDELAALREELAITNRNLDETVEQGSRLRLRLTAAEQRNAEMSSMLVDVLEWFDDGVSRSDAEFAFLRDIANYLASHDKPTESGASECTPAKES